MHRATKIRDVCKGVEQDEWDERINSVVSILVLHIREHTPTVTTEQYYTVNRFIDLVESEAKRKLA